MAVEYSDLRLLGHGSEHVVGKQNSRGFWIVALLLTSTSHVSSWDKALSEPSADRTLAVLVWNVELLLISTVICGSWDKALSMSSANRTLAVLDRGVSAV